MHRDDVLGLAVDAVGIGQHQAAFVIGPRLEIEDASGEHVRHDVLERVFVDPFVIQAEQRQPLFPRLLALLAIEDRDGGVVVVVAIDVPFKTQGNERRAFGDELAGGGPVRRMQGEREE